MALSSRFAELRKAFLSSNLPAGRGELADAVRAFPALRRPAFRAAAMDLGEALAKRRVMVWAEEVQPEAEALYRATMARFVELANGYVERLSAGAADAGVLTPEEFCVERGFRQDTQFFFTSLLTLAAPGFWAWMLDWIRPRSRLIASAIRQASRYLDHLMVTNSARVANDLTARVEESQRRLESEIRGRLSVLVTTAERALGRARTQQAAGAEAVRAGLSRIDAWHAQVERLLDRQA